jgi:hypothetical protein
MHKWMASAAGGTRHRLKPGPATVRSFASQPRPEPALDDGAVPASDMVVFSLDVFYVGKAPPRCGRDRASDAGLAP